ncbi:MAG: SapC family protein [Pseudomonadota bacterium]
MARQLLIYERAVPLSSQRHAGWSIRATQRYGVARDVNSLPVMATEIPAAARDHAIVFAGQDLPMPAVILGARDGQNLYLDDNDGWRVSYVPAFLRRYPFVFANTAEGKAFTLCIDETYDGCNQNGEGERLFDSTGERTQYLQNVINFVQKYQVEFERTKQFCERLKSLDLLAPVQISLKVGSGQQIGLAGVQAVNREKLKALQPDVVHDLLKSDALELIYVHLNSLANLQRLAQWAGGQASGGGNGIDLSRPSDEPSFDSI